MLKLFFLLRAKIRAKISVPCPEAIALYNQYMGGVDLNDQLRQYYHIRLKSQKQYFYLMWFFFDVALTNSYILARNYSYVNIKCVKDYCLQLAKELNGQYSSRKWKGRKSAFVSTKKFKRGHFPVIGDGKQYPCYHCSQYKHLRKDTKWKCEHCNVYLCHNGKDDDCFLQYHIKYIKSEY